MKGFIIFFILSALVVLAHCFGSTEDRFIKKYAMMKIYESCFGPEVVKQIRKEMKAACAKCALLESSPTPPPPPVQDSGNGPSNGGPSPSFDAEKLHQAILAYRPSSPFQGQSFRPYSGAPQAFYNPAFNPAFYQANPLFYPGFQQMPYSPYAMPIVGQQYFGNRVSRDMDIRSQLDALTSRLSGKVKNITCVMQELGYLDENLEPNYAKITERIGNLPISDELRRDMQDGVTFCQQFSQCVPEVKKDKSPLSRELIRPMFFFKCYKHKKLEACIMKDVREKYAGVTDDDFDGEVELRRTGKAKKLPGENTDQEINDLANSMYDFLYGSEASAGIDEIL